MGQPEAMVNALVLVAAGLIALTVLYFLMSGGPKQVFPGDKKKRKLVTTVIENAKITHDTYRLRVSLPTKSHVLGLKCGYHVKIEGFHPDTGKKESRAYTPTSDGFRTKGEIEFIIKAYEKGVISRYCGNLKVDDKMTIMGPIGHIHYQGKGRFERITAPKQLETSHIGMFAGGTGITPMLQIIKEILAVPEDKTKVSMIFANKSEADILVKDYLDDCEKEAKKQGKELNIWYTLDKAPEGWKYSEGFVNQDMVKDHMPPPGDNPVMCFCGPDPMYRYAVKPHLEALKYDMKRTMKF